MLNAAEAAMDASAKDDSERQRNHMKLYAPPEHIARARSAGGRAARPGRRMDLDAARALMAQMAREDARIAGQGSG